MLVRMPHARPDNPRRLTRARTNEPGRTTHHARTTQYARPVMQAGQLRGFVSVTAFGHDFQSRTLSHSLPMSSFQPHTFSHSSLSHSSLSQSPSGRQAPQSQPLSHSPSAIALQSQPLSHSPSVTAPQAASVSSWCSLFGAASVIALQSQPPRSQPLRPPASRRGAPCSERPAVRTSSCRPRPAAGLQSRGVAPRSCPRRSR